jgi:hypothetical protein
MGTFWPQNVLNTSSGAVSGATIQGGLPNDEILVGTSLSLSSNVVDSTALLNNIAA